jgi:putative membrane protein
MKRNYVKALAVVLSASLIAGTGAVYAVKADKEESGDLGSKIMSYVEKKDYETELFQDETVYVINNSDGEQEKTIVVDKLKDNVNGSETVSNRQLNTETPVQVNVSYELDGNAVAAADLAGRSGHVKITYDYVNTQYETVNVNGKDEKIYVPFAAVTGTILNSDVFSNIKVEGGRLIDDGTRTAVVGVALPGLSESLGAEGNMSDSVKIPESLTIEADVKDFELGTVYTLVTNYDLDEFSVDENGIKNTLTSAIDTAKDGFAQILDGSAQLSEGLAAAKDGSAALVDGALAAYDGSMQLADGAKAVNSGAAQLANGLGDALTGSGKVSDGAAQLSAGLDTLSGNSAAIVAGAEQVYAKLLAQAEAGIKEAGIDIPSLTIDNYAAVLDAAAAQIGSADPEKIAEAKVRASVEANRSAIEMQVAAAVKAQTGATDEMMASDQMKAVVAQKTEEQIEALTAQNMASEEVQSQIKAGNEQIKAGVAAVENVKKSLDDYNTFYQGVKAYTAGVDTADQGAAQLNAGVKSLNDGIDKLHTGAKTLEAGTTSLSAGADELRDGLEALEAGEEQLDNGLDQLSEGAKALNDGLNRINDELVIKLEAFINDDIEGLADRLKALKQVSDDYKCIDTLGDAGDGTVKFIYKTEAIK